MTTPVTKQTTNQTLCDVVSFCQPPPHTNNAPNYDQQPPCHHIDVQMASLHDAGLWAMHCSTSRVTGYPPYFPLYSQQPFFAFDFAGRTWETLNWHKVTSTEDLLAICMQQILHHNKKLVLAMEEQKHTRQQAVDDFNSKHEKYLTFSDFALGMWVLLHEMWLDSQMGNKGTLRWTGPYIVHHKVHDTTYQLQELDGTVI